MSRIQVVAIAWLAFVIGLICVHAILPQPSGVLALTEVFEPYIALTAIVAAGVAALSGRRIGRVLALALIAVLLVRCAPALVSNPDPGGGEYFSVMTWNVLADHAADRTVSVVRESDASLIGLQELQPDATRALEADPTITQRLPFQALEPERTVRGIGLLSAYPILEHSVSIDPPYLRAVVQPEFGDSIVVYVVHPLPARIDSIAGLPVSLDTTKRDADIALIRAQVDADLAANRQVIVMGDLNTTEREPAYQVMTAGLTDAHLEAGIGPGLTWRPPSLKFLPFGLLRIDYIFASRPQVFEGTGVRCDTGSDHCAVHTTIH